LFGSPFCGVRRFFAALAFWLGAIDYREGTMTEAEWFACEKVWLLAAALGYPGGRKFRLLLVASCRRWLDWHDQRLLGALEAAEYFADGLVSAESLLQAETDVLAALKSRYEPDGRIAGRIYDLHCLCHDAATHDLEAWSESSWGDFSYDFLTPHLVREIWSGLFRPMPPDPEPAPAYARSLARVIYEERLLPSGYLDNARLAVLSDALEEAGCTDDDILAHLRSPGPHVRGCWALDLVLGKE
jgi:hypothetical protein